LYFSIHTGYGTQFDNNDCKDLLHKKGKAAQMNALLFLSDVKGATNGRLLSVVQSVVLTTHLEVLRNFNKLAVRLNKLPKDISIIVLFAQNRKQLLKLVALRPYMEGIRIILVVPDDESITIALGHLLRPSLLTSAHAIADFADVAAVLSKCLD
jgi:hypothetical protein